MCAQVYIYIYVHTHTHIPFWRIIWQNPKVFKEKQYYQELRVLILSNCSICYIPAQETGQEETTANVKIKAEVLTMADRVLCDNLPPPLLQPPDSWTCQAQSLWGHVEGGYGGHPDPLAQQFPTFTVHWNCLWIFEKYNAWLLSSDILSDLTGEAVKPGRQDFLKLPRWLYCTAKFENCCSGLRSSFLVFVADLYAHITALWTLFTTASGLIQSDLQIRGEQTACPVWSLAVPPASPLADRGALNSPCSPCCHTQSLSNAFACTPFY